MNYIVDACSKGGSKFLGSVQYEHVGFLWNMLEHLSMLKFVMRIGKATKDELYAHSYQGFLKSL